MATFVNNLRLTEIATGDESGTWGTTTNSNWDFTTDAFGYGVKNMAGDANETFTMADGTVDTLRSMYLKITSTVAPLTATRTLTIAPNTVSKVWVIENNAAGSQSIIIKQGSGATVTIATGTRAMVYTDGLGSGAAVFLASPSISALGGTLPVSSGGTGQSSNFTQYGVVYAPTTTTLGNTGAGTTTTVLHGNAAGAPTYGAVSLNADVSGTLPIARGGTGTTLTTYANLTTNVTGTLPIANGGTNGTASPTTNGVTYGTGSTYAFTAAGTTGQVLTATTGSAPTWASVVTGVTTVVRSTRTSNTILGISDQGTLVDVTSGTFSQTFTAAATLGNGWFVYLRNSGTGDITLDPNASELIDGLATYIMYPGETRLVQCSGTAFTSLVLSPFSKTFTANGTFTKPPGYQQFGGLIWSGGASGQKSGVSGTLAQGGADGGCGNFILLTGSFSATTTATVGAGGTAVTGTADGNVGNASSLGSLINAYAGTVYNTGGSVLSGAKSGTTGSEPANYEGAAAGTTPRNCFWGGGAGSSTGANAGAACWYGGAAGGSISAADVVAAAGTSVFGGNGGAASSASSGTAGTAPGGGGGATQTGTASGAGARGEIRVWGLI